MPKNTTVVLDHNAASFQPEHWQGMTDLDEFRPERFLEFKPKPLTGMPFGFGGRMCLGKRVAELELQALAVDFVQNYKWEHDPQEPLELGMALALTSKKGVMCKFASLD